MRHQRRLQQVVQARVRHEPDAGRERDRWEVCLGRRVLRGPEGSDVAEPRGDDLVAVLDSKQLREPHTLGTSYTSTCDPTFNDAFDLNDNHLLGLATITGLTLLDQCASKNFLDRLAAPLTLTVDVFMKCSDCVYDAAVGCVEFDTAMIAGSVRILLDTAFNFDMVPTGGHGAPWPSRSRASLLPPRSTSPTTSWS